MALATRCPHCQTAFKVANDQLKLHAGLVRCGSCQQTFNAVENLIPADGQKVVATPAVTTPVATTSATVTPVAATPATPGPSPVAKASTPNTPTTPAATSNAAKPVTQAANISAPAPVAASVPVTATTPTVPAPNHRILLWDAAGVAATTPPPAPTPATPAPVVAPAVEASPAPEIKAVARTGPAVSTRSPAEPAAPVTAIAPVTASAAGKPLINKPGNEILAAISKAEKEFEAENLDQPKATPVPAKPAAATTAESKASKPIAAITAPVAPTAVVKPAPVVSASTIDFDLGDGSFPTTMEDISDSDVARAELETRAALMDPPTADWSINERAEDTKPTSSNTAPATTTKVWRHKETAPVETDSTSQAEAEIKPSDDKTDKAAYIGAEEAALANHAAVSEDSSSDADEKAHRPNFVIQAEKQQRRKRVTTVMLTLMVLLLFPSLLAQSAYIFRSQLAAWLPESKPHLQQACQLLQCQVKLPAQIEQITVESNELQALAPDRNVFLLVMQIQNHSSLVQAWPTVELILNDTKDKAVLQRVFGPEDYLTEKDKLSKGFTAGSDQNIKLYFELPKLKAAGYHVSVFYP
ncbi:DUF3426 domain-containing protein [Undibacterium sp. Di26W]|uniref:DUF3426 domain-containing protein n=1 Tax=Undibacterium sp. Di26W TaxID=3413035 RepID=UPI003BF384B4